MDLREFLYKEKEETLDKLDALIVYASFMGYTISVYVSKFNKKVFITFNTGSGQGYIYLTIKENVVSVGTDVTFYLEKIHNKFSKDFDEDMNLDQTIDVVMKTL